MRLPGSRWLWIGLALLVVGTGPLVVSVLWLKWQGDPNPNPVGPGMCAMFTFWPSVALIAVGVVATILRRRPGPPRGEPR
jgi:hypothetical protein